MKKHWPQFGLLTVAAAAIAALAFLTWRALADAEPADGHG